MFTRTLAIIMLALAGLVAIPAQARDGHDSNNGPRIVFSFSNYENVWVPGYWERHGHHHVWVEGYWARQPAHYDYGHRRHERYDGYRGERPQRKCG